MWEEMTPVCSSRQKMVVFEMAEFLVLGRGDQGPSTRTCFKTASNCGLPIANCGFSDGTIRNLRQPAPAIAHGGLGRRIRLRRRKSEIRNPRGFEMASNVSRRNRVKVLLGTARREPTVSPPREGPVYDWPRRGYSTVAVLQLPKLATRDRFPLPAV